MREVSVIAKSIVFPTFMNLIFNRFNKFTSCFTPTILSGALLAINHAKRAPFLCCRHSSTDMWDSASVLHTGQVLQNRVQDQRKMSTQVATDILVVF